MCDSCGCGTTDTAVTITSTAAAETAVFAVTGMTCGHCVNSVTSEVGRLDAVTAVDIDLADGSMTIRSERPVSRDTIQTAVEAAGYQLADR